ncbi:MAG: hypothetical protein KIT34_01075 [Cyanobacteria bacterium TGS_CYA1]|nr:hypothetical protein [Cyanobacteria bacterium TGS_CYA1]
MSASDKKPAKKKKDDAFLKDYESRTEKGSLSYDYAGAACYFPFLPLASYFWLQNEAKTNEFLRFNSIQSMVMFCIWLACGVVLGTIRAIVDQIPFVGAIIGILFLIIQIMISVLYGIGCIRLGFTTKAGKKAKVWILSKQIEEYMKKNPTDTSVKAIGQDEE